MSIKVQELLSKDKVNMIYNIRLRSHGTSLFNIVMARVINIKNYTWKRITNKN